MNKYLSVHAIIAATYLVLALLTVIPREAASKACRLGYKALCSFTPYGTLILMLFAGLHLYLHWRAAARTAEQASPST